MVFRFARKQIAFLAAAFLLPSVTGCAQGCAMCYASAAAQGPRAIQALNLGILVLLIPTVAIFGGIFWLAYRRRNPWAVPEAAQERQGTRAGRWWPRESEARGLRSEV